MHRINRPKLSDMVADALVNFTLENSLKPGDKLPTEKELSGTLGIGRTSVREGIRQLEATGLLSSHQGDGVYIKEVTLDSCFDMNRKIPLASFLILTKTEVLDLVETRLIIELAACKIAAHNIKDEQIGVLKDKIKAMRATISKPDEFIVHDIHFHKQIITATGNVLLPKFYELIEDLYSKQQAIVAGLPKAIDRAIGFHEKICTALEERNEKLAVETMKAHLEDTKKVLSKSLE